MIPNQKMKGENGLENALFPLKHLYVTNNEAGHKKGSMAIDIVEWSTNGQVLKAPLYAPVSCKVVEVGSIATDTPHVTWESLDKVNFVDGSVDYMTISLSHDDNFDTYKVGDVVSQGEIFGHTGTRTASIVGMGDHCHLIIGKGKFTKYTKVQEAYTLENQYHSYLALGVNDTIINKTGGYTWKSFTPYVPPEPSTEDTDFIRLSLVGALKWSV